MQELIQASLEVKSYGTISGKIISIPYPLLLLHLGPFYEFVSKGGSLFFGERFLFVLFLHTKLAAAASQ